MFIVGGGSGTAAVDGEEIELEKNISVHVPYDVEHIVKKEEGWSLIRIFLILVGFLLLFLAYKWTHEYHVKR